MITIKNYFIEMSFAFSLILCLDCDFSQKNSLNTFFNHLFILYISVTVYFLQKLKNLTILTDKTCRVSNANKNVQIDKYLIVTYFSRLLLVAKTTILQVGGHYQCIKIW